MVSWIALGVLVVVAGGLVWVAWRQRATVTTPEPHTEFPGLFTRGTADAAITTEHAKHAAKVEAEQAAAEEPVSLDENQLRELRVLWPLAMCQHCGTVHQGSCPRIREVRYHPNGNEKRIIYWGDAQWRPPKGAITAADVYGAAGISLGLEETT